MPLTTLSAHISSFGPNVSVLVQDVRNGRVITIVDNRAMLLAQRMAGENAEGQKALGALLGGGKS